ERFPAWFYAILRNEAFNFLKKARRGLLDSLDDPAFPLEPVDPAGEDPERAELTRRVWEAICKLPLELQEILVMQHFQGMDYREISGLLGIPRGSVASRLYRARTALKQKLGGVLDRMES
ncbi:MAG: sigma-70 family RNA polymerase sigma factor, partial [Candidatus Glassbacteria bacterium]|nr:sigma-70 family RNA polymerase sigma factor [Candidatus Glassbacteria bacterium]